MDPFNKESLREEVTFGFSMSGFSRNLICLSIPTSSSSTFTFNVADVSMYLQLYFVDIFLASEIQI